jgi:hypothetical protein
LEVHNQLGVLVATGTTVLNSDTWYVIEVYCGTGSSAGWEVRINEVTEMSGTADLDTTHHDYFRLGRPGAVSILNTVDYYYDNLVFSDWWVGDAYVNMHLPNADGAAHDWHNGTGTTYAEVDEAVIDAAVTELETDGTDDQEHQVAFAVCGETEPILATMAQAITLSPTPRAIALQTIVGATTDETSVAFNGRVAYVDTGQCSLRKIHTNSPDTGVAWTTAELDSIQIGLRNDNVYSSGARYCTQMCYKVLLLREGPSPSASPSGSPSVSPSASPSLIPGDIDQDIDPVSQDAYGKVLSENLAALCGYCLPSCQPSEGLQISVYKKPTAERSVITTEVPERVTVFKPD